MMAQAVMRVMGNNGEWQIKLHWLDHRSPPAVWPRGWGPLTYMKRKRQQECIHTEESLHENTARR